MKRFLCALVACCAFVACTSTARTQQPNVPAVAPLSIGETIRIFSTVLDEERRINVYAPPVYVDDPALRLPVLYMPDGGLGEDFLHIAGLLQISILNGTMRPFLLVGIENTQRRRDLTGPTTSDEDRKIAPVVGGSAAFREFLRSELIPFIDSRYRTTAERAIVGESLAGLFVVETLMVDPELFDTYIAIDPSLWWSDAALVDAASTLLRSRHGDKILYLATSDEAELAALVTRFREVAARSGAGVVLRYRPMPTETHGTIYHPAALAAFRDVFGRT